MQEFGRARYSGPLVRVSEQKDFGFVRPEDIRLEFGQHGPIPKTGVFVHKKVLPYLKELRHGMGISFEIRNSTRKEGGLDAVVCELEPLFTAFLTNVSENGEFGFVKPEHMEIDVTQADIFSDIAPSYLFPSEDIFVHKNSFKQRPARLKNGTQVSFRVERSRVGKNAGKLIAYKLTLRY